MPQIQEPAVVTANLLRKLAEAKGPCITLLVPGGAGNFRAQLQNAIKDIHRQLVSHDVKDAESWTENFGVMPEPSSGETQVILKSPEIFESFPLSKSLPALAHAGEFFMIRALLPAFSNTDEFNLLALSQNRSRLLHCTLKASAEVALPPGTPASLSDSMQTRKPDHTLDNRFTGGPSTGSMKGVLFTTNTESEDKDEYLLHFFSSLEKGVSAFLRDSTLPLIPVGVEEELAIYRRVNTYPHLVEQGVAGAPDGLKGGEIHSRALEVLQEWAAENMKKAFANFDKQVGTGHASIHAHDIILAAHDGRVSQLFLREDAEFLGTFDDVRHKLKRHEDPITPRGDLLNDAAVATLKHGGEARVLRPDQMPNGVPLAALFRYALTPA